MGISELVKEYGKEEIIEESALAFYQEGLSIETIAKCLKTTQEKIEKLFP